MRDLERLAHLRPSVGIDSDAPQLEQPAGAARQKVEDAAIRRPSRLVRPGMICGDAGPCPGATVGSACDAELQPPLCCQAFQARHDEAHPLAVWGIAPLTEVLVLG